ncbi:unnamed protein product [Brassica rapa subsp. trilocularis]
MIGSYASMSETLPTMIAWNHLPTIYTYQEVIKGLCKNEKQFEAFCVFNDLKERGYAPDRVVYTTMITRRALNVKPSDRTYAALRKMRNILKMSDCLLQLP